MLLTSVSSFLLVLFATTYSVSALPVEESRIEGRSSSGCRTILKGHLVGFDSHNKQFNFVPNSAKEVAYDHDSKSNHKLYVNFQQCPDYKNTIGDEDGFGYVGRLYVPALKGCISNPSYLQSTSADAEYYPIITPCDATTSLVAEDSMWKYYVSEDFNDLNYVYWVANPNRLQPGCFGLYGFRAKSKSDSLPYTRPGHQGAIEFSCGVTSPESGFFVQ